MLQSMIQNDNRVTASCIKKAVFGGKYRLKATTINCITVFFICFVFKLFRNLEKQSYSVTQNTIWLHKSTLTRGDIQLNRTFIYANSVWSNTTVYTRILLRCVFQEKFACISIYKEQKASVYHLPKFSFLFSATELLFPHIYEILKIPYKKIQKSTVPQNAIISKRLFTVLDIYSTKFDFNTKPSNCSVDGKEQMLKMANSVTLP